MAAEASQEFLEEVDTLYKDYKIEDCRAKFNGYEESENVEILWRLARVILEQYKLSGKNEKAFAHKSYELITKAEKLSSEPNFNVHKWYAVILDAMGEVEGKKFKITNASLVKKLIQKGIEINDNDAYLYHCLGSWHFFFADLNWYTRKLTIDIIGSAPASTYEMAMVHFMKAEDIEPGFYNYNQLMIGKVYMKLKNNESATEWLKKVCDLEIKTADDELAKKEAEMFLKSIVVE